MEVNTLLKKRSAQKKVIKRLFERIGEINENDSQFPTIIQELKTKYSLMEDINDDIEKAVDEDSYETEIVETADYMMELKICIQKLDEKRQTAVAVQPPPPLPRNVCNIESDVIPPQTNSFPSTASFTGTSSITSSNYRLPKLTLPTFSGELLKWQHFWDSFESTVHNNITLTDVQKFSYLQSQLDGDAARTIEGFPLTNANYNRAVQLLRERFGQTHKITHAYMQSLTQLQAPTSNLHSLRSFYDKMEAYIRGLESLGQAQDSFGSLLVPIIIDKLPVDIKRQLAREHSDGNWMLQDLRSAIFREINILEAGISSEVSSQGMCQTTASFYTNTSNHGNARPFVKRAHTTSYRKCAFCEDEHFPNDCTKVTDHASRLNIVKKKKLCFNCLGNHQVSKCKSIKRCRKCKRKHHSSICSIGSNSAETTTHPAVASSTTPANVVLQDDAIFHLSSPQEPSHVLLKTAIAPVCNNVYSTDANILFDEGAQRSFHHRETCERTSTDTRCYRCCPVGDVWRLKAKNVRSLETATVYVKTDRGDKLSVRVLIVPIIAKPLNISYQRKSNKPDLI